MASRQDHLHILRSPTNFQEHGFHAITTPVRFTRDLLLYRENRLRLPKIHQVIAALHAQNDAGDQITLPRGVFLLNRLPFRFTNLLKNDLLGGLGRDSPQFVHFDQGPDLVSHLGFTVILTGFAQRNFGLGITDRLNDRLLGDDGNFPGLRINLNLYVFSLAKPFFCGGLQSGFDGSDHARLVDSLLAPDFVNH